MLSRASLLALEVVLSLPVKMVAANSAGERGGGGGGAERGDWDDWDVGSKPKCVPRNPPSGGGDI